MRLPVYVLFTKADLIAGFIEFFDDLGKEERAQVWGVTFAAGRRQERRAAPSPSFAGRSSTLLLERLNDRMLERLQQEPDIRPAPR